MYLGGFIIKRIIFIFIFSLILCYIGFSVFSPIFYSNSIIIDYGLRDFDICIEQPILWHYIKMLFVVVYIGSSISIFNSIYSILKNILKKFKPNTLKNCFHNSKKINISFPSLIENKRRGLNLLIRRNT